MIDRLQIPHNAQFYKLANNQDSLPNIAINNIISIACKNRQGSYLIGPEYTRIEDRYGDIEYK